ncbi:uncharacterized protein MONOS_1570 [Monocercomonoides exilis]|uniref:uncharacterized protein n=1 Tax=Monocercomonoides exilis TaxID=2049356 RepID=UPI003559BEE2|nr:hypothetical protein MONOS_1570 [Monocercomonoides exilis]|eukprot:MONOS_1570.1-p1 / transcript=MONOS_1570.1 / gene=MONOS_1570 / organism=Monocercomonoides_exilis_PA203 / gene_product=unspecified product / transcript_product=unspecified product / location=Mono_scaffold00028:63411-64134(+) / protein_length=83 / sequence_SO=supercontig / SO=protein_coding / is_pseudo=false
MGTTRCAVAERAYEDNLIQKNGFMVWGDGVEFLEEARTFWPRLSFAGQVLEAEAEEDEKKERQAQHFAVGVWGWIRDKDGAR